MVRKQRPYIFKKALLDGSFPFVFLDARFLRKQCPVALKMIATDPRVQLMSVQLFGGVPEEM